MFIANEIDNVLRRRNMHETFSESVHVKKITVDPHILLNFFLALSAQLSDFHPFL
jgi:hypothetical protein